ncbi:MAG TPA: glycosyltransferase family 39 protein [Tepidisphaeraceae bacterium]|nr:glycosyltransferase family 39 protein [Tepidisphaeraceae bacterium]
MNLRKLHPAAIFGTVFLVALLMRLVVLYQINGDPHLDSVGGDGTAYLKWADTIARGDWIGHDVFYPSPLYPYLLAVFQKVSGWNLNNLLMTQALIGSAGCGLLALAGRKLFDPLTGLLGGLLMAIYPPAISYDLQVDKTVLDPPLVAAMLWCLASALSRSRPKVWLSCGLIIGVFALTRENALAFVLPILIWIGWQLRSIPMRQRAVSSIMLLIGISCIVLPVCFRNSLVGGKFHLTTAKFGANFYYGNSAKADGIYFPLRPGRGDLLYEQQDAVELAEEATGRHLTLSEVSGYWTYRTLTEMAANPWGWFKLTLKKIAMFWSDTEIADADIHDRHIVFSLLLRALDHVLGFGLIFSMGMAGAAIVWDRRPQIVILLMLLAIYSLAIAAFILFGRYRLPAVPLLMPLAAAAVVHLPQTVNEKRWGRISFAGLAACFAIGLMMLGEHCIPQRIRGTNPFNRASIFASIGQTGQAISQYQKAIRQNADLQPAWVNLSLLLTEKGEFKQAESVARRAVQLNPNDPKAHTNLGIALAGDSQIDLAIEEFTKAIELDPANRTARLDLASALLRTDRREQGVVLLKDLATTQPADESSQRARQLLDNLPQAK